MPNVERTMENLQKRGFQVSRFPDRAAAVEYLLDEIGDTPVGIGGSMTVQEIDLFPRLLARGDTFFHMIQREEGIMDHAIAAPIYLMSANGVSESGQIINIDGTGNRVVNMAYGHERVYVIIGVNKIAATDEMALWRARNIASPKNARRIGKKTPCVQGELICHDCDSPERICRSFVSLERCPTSIPHFEIVIIDEALGY